MQVTLQNPLDMHLHLRDEEMLKKIAHYSARDFSGAIIMPNLVPPVTTKEMVVAYQQRIMEAAEDTNFAPYMTLFFQNYDRSFLEEVQEVITAIKLYPAGITTNSEGGVGNFDIDTLRATLEAMSDLGIPLCVHGESDGFVMDREREFGSVYEALASNFPNLTIIMEHITDKNSVELLDRYENLYATITLHHLAITLDDVAGGMLQPHLFCKPIAKRPEDREALLEVALNAHPKVMFGSDSAPHPRSAKESLGCAAGVFSAPVILPVLAELFDRHGVLPNLQKFISDNAVSIYGVTPPQKEIVLEKRPMQVEETYGGVVPYLYGENIAWSVRR
jgi:dihydroorotase